MRELSILNWLSFYLWKKIFLKKTIVEFDTSNDQLAYVLTKSLREARIQYICSTFGAFYLYALPLVEVFKIITIIRIEMLKLVAIITISSCNNLVSHAFMK